MKSNKKTNILSYMPKLLKAHCKITYEDIKNLIFEKEKIEELREDDKEENLEKIKRYINYGGE